MFMDNDKLNNPASAGNAANPAPEQPAPRSYTDPFGSVGFEAAPSGQPIPEQKPEPIPIPNPTVATPKEKISKKTIILIVILVVLIAAAAVGAILIFKPFDQKPAKKTPSSSQVTPDTPEEPAKKDDTEGEKITDEATIKALKIKANTILSAGSITEDSDSIMTDTYITSTRALQSMSDSTKLAIVLDFSKATEATAKNINDMADNTYQSFGFTGRNSVLGLYYLPYNTAVENAYNSTFGKSEIGIVFPGTLATDRSDYEFVYDNMHKGFFLRPKNSPGSKTFYTYDVTTKDDQYYVYFAAGSSLYNADEKGNIDYDNGTDYLDYDCVNKAKDGSFRMMVTEVNYKDYAHYRLVFTKDGDNYLFQKLEKLE